jgi:hypothetical protein
MDAFLRLPVLLRPPPALAKVKTARVLSWIFVVTFIFACLIFSLAYGITSAVACSQNLVTVDAFIPDAVACTCANNPGTSSIMASAILGNTTFSSQFTFIGQNILYKLPAPLTGANRTANINSYPLFFYFLYQFPVEFTTTVVNKTVLMFEFDTTVFDLASIYKSVGGSYNATCDITVLASGPLPSISFTGYNSIDCLNFINQNIVSGFNDRVDISYTDNYAYAKYCDLQSCQIKECSGVQQINICLFISSICAFFYMTLNIVQKVVFQIWLHFHEKRGKGESSPLNIVTPA